MSALDVHADHSSDLYDGVHWSTNSTNGFRSGALLLWKPSNAKCEVMLFLEISDTNTVFGYTHPQKLFGFREGPRAIVQLIDINGESVTSTRMAKSLTPPTKTLNHNHYAQKKYGGIVPKDDGLLWVGTIDLAPCFRMSANASYTLLISPSILKRKSDWELEALIGPTVTVPISLGSEDSEKAGNGGAPED